MTEQLIYSYPDEVARKWKQERDAFESQLAATQAKLDIAVEALRNIRNNGLEGHVGTAQDRFMKLYKTAHDGLEQIEATGQAPVASEGGE